MHLYVHELPFQTVSFSWKTAWPLKNCEVFPLELEMCSPLLSFLIPSLGYPRGSIVQLQQNSRIFHGVEVLVRQSGLCHFPSLALFGCSIKVSVCRVLCACWGMAQWERILTPCTGVPPSHSSGGVQSHSLVPSDLSRNPEAFYHLSYLQWSLFSLFPLFFSWKSCTVPHVDLVKYVVELPHILLFLCMYKALLFPLPGPALDSRVGAVPFQPSVPSEVAPAEHHFVLNLPEPWPPAVKAVPALSRALAVSQEYLKGGAELR